MKSHYEAIRSRQVAHNHLFAVFELLVGHMPGTKAKLTKRLGHQRTGIILHTKGGTSRRGFGVQRVARMKRSGIRGTAGQCCGWAALGQEIGPRTVISLAGGRATTRLSLNATRQNVYRQPPDCLD